MEPYSDMDPHVRAALHTEQLLGAIVDSSDDAIASKDLNGIITSWNKSAERIFGYTAQEIIGRPVNILIPSDRQDEEPSILDRIRRGIRIEHFETVRRRKDGKLINVSVSISPIRDMKGQIVGASKVARDITDRKADEQARRLLSAIVESSEDAIASKDLNGFITSWNRGAEHLLGYTASEIIGKHVTILFPSDRLDEEPGVMRRILKGQPVEQYETLRRRKDGSLVDVSLTLSPIFDETGKVIGASKILRDITRRKSAERAMRLLSAIVESSDDAIASKDLNGILTSWNTGAERLLGYKAEEVIGKPVTMLIPADHADEEPGILRRIRRGERIMNYQTVRRRKDGGLVPVSLTVSPIKDENGQVIGASKILRDITETLRAREKLEELVAERTAELRETVSELEAFSYSVAHDMRAPLRVMNSYAKIIEEDFGSLIPEQAGKLLGRISSAAKRLDVMITDVLDYSRISRGDMKMERVDLEAITADIVNSYAHLREHGAEIVIEAPLPPVMANPAALAQCISNLLSNAVKFVPEGKTPAVRVSGERRGKFVRICVSDNGIGISQEGQTRLFGIFERLNNSAQFEGTGIGLAIVRRAVLRMNGRCGVKSRLGEGSQFWIELKAAE